MTQRLLGSKQVHNVQTVVSNKMSFVRVAYRVVGDDDCTDLYYSTERKGD